MVCKGIRLIQKNNYPNISGFSGVACGGAMVSEGYRYLFTTPILSFAPGIAIMLTVFAVNMVGDGLRDALDPRLRGSL